MKDCGRDSLGNEPDPVEELAGSMIPEAEPSELPRSKVRLSREMFSTIFSLTDKQPWLKEKQVPLIDLIDECTQQEQQLLIFELLQRFTFLDGNDFQFAIQRIADFIQSDLGLDEQNCSIAASENSRYADSSQLVAYMLKTAKWKSNGWNTTSFVSSLSGLTAGPVKENLFIVDEFIGTGETAEKKVKWIKGRLEDSEILPKIYVAVVAGMEEGIKRVSEVADVVFSAHVLKRGISDGYETDKVQPNIDAMKSLESGLAKQGRRGVIERHSLGYKGSEALYARANGNTPNNVFPVFWWEARNDGSPRDTILQCI